MALVRLTRSIFGIWKINNTTINGKDVISKGAYGIVYKGKDVKKNVVAVKATDG